jgi:uncharacterized membrane protein
MTIKQINTHHWYHPRSVGRSILLRPHLMGALAVGLLTSLALPHSLSGSVREALAWTTGGLFYLGVVIQLMSTSTSEAITSRAARQDNSRAVIIALILIAIASSLVSIAGLMSEAKAATPNVKLLYLGLAAATIIVSWAVMQVLFTLHYAHEYYRPNGGESDLVRGLDFPGENSPDYWDFLYFATSIGAASQTADVSIRSKAIRRVATVHAVVSFFFNSAVMALTINLAASVI